VVSIALRKESSSGLFNGTSAAAPHVSGFAALIAQTQPGLRGVALRDAVERAVQSVGQPVPNNIAGFGIIDGNRVAFDGQPSAPLPAGSPPAPPPARAPDALDAALDELLREQEEAPQEKRTSPRSRP
jgi:hypothetical protein